MKLKIDFNLQRELDVDGRGKVRFRPRDFMVKPGRKISLKRDFDSGFTGGFDDKAGALEKVASNVERVAELQERLYAQDVYSLLVIFQAIDAAGKDGAIRHVMSGVNPQGCHVTSFKAPSAEELDHDYLWRAAKALPGRGMIGIFNRSYYEEVLVVRVHPEYLEKQKLPPIALKDIWEHRFSEINNFERYLVRNGTVIVKFFLNISRKEQKKRFLARIDEPDKNWKFSIDDYKERARWDDYQEAFEAMLRNTSTESAPWFIIPADNKWFARLAISQIITTTLEGLELKMPVTTPQRRAELLKVRRQLMSER